MCSAVDCDSAAYLGSVAKNEMKILCAAPSVSYRLFLLPLIMITTLYVDRGARSDLSLRTALFGLKQLFSNVFKSRERKKIKNRNPTRPVINRLPCQPSCEPV